MRIILEHACMHAVEIAEMTSRPVETRDPNLAPVAI